MTRRMLEAIGLVLVSACGSASSTPSSATAAPAPVANTASAPVAAKGLELLCEGDGIAFRITDATLTPSDVEQKRAQGRWNQVRATYTLEANGQTLTGALAGARDQDFVFMALDEIDASGGRKVQLIVNSPDGKLASVRWPAPSAGQEARSGKVTCSGSLLTASPS